MAAIFPFFCEGHGEANLKRFADGAGSGMKVRIDNRAFLAFCY